MTKDVMTKTVRDYLRRIGQRGGEAKGRAKVRGDASHYRAMSRKRWDKQSGNDKNEPTR